MNIIKHNLSWASQLVKRTSTDFLILHHSESPNGTVESIHEYHRSLGWQGIGYNLVIYKDGSIHEGRPFNMADSDARGYNYNSLSVCFIGNFENEKMTEEQLISAINLCRYIRGLYPKIKILRHKDVNNTKCPGVNFPDTIIYEGMKDAPQEQNHWADVPYQKLIDAGIVIHEKRFEDPIKRGELFALLSQIIKG